MYNQKFNREEYEITRQTFLNIFKNSCQSKHFSKYDRIAFNLGEEVMQLVEGRAKVSAYSEAGAEKLLYILSPGDLMGEIDYFVDHSPDIEIIALTNVKIIVIPKNIFENVLAENPTLYRHLIISIIRKYQIIRAQLSDTVFRNSKGKLAAFLLSLSSQEGQFVSGHYECFYIKHQDIAAIIGCSRVTVTRMIHDFVTAGAIDIKGDKILIYSEELLRSYIQEGARI